MSIDSFESELGKMAKREYQSELEAVEILERFSSGEIDEIAAAASLRALDDSLDVDKMLRLGRPLCDSYVAEILGKLPSSSKDIPTSEEEKRSIGAKRFVLGAAAFLAAFAAALVVFLVLGEPPSALPSYELEVGGSLAKVRGETSPVADGEGPLRYTGDSRMTVVLKPDRSFGKHVEARLFAKRGEQSLELPAEIRVSRSGSIRLEYDMRKSAPLQTGDWIFGVVVCSPELGDGEEMMATLFEGSAAETPCRTFKWNVRMEAP